jgi:hypothetical protein
VVIARAVGAASEDPRCYAFQIVHTPITMKPAPAAQAR